MKRDYMVSYENSEVIISNLKIARKEAKALSKEHGYAKIEKWVYADSDMVIDDYFLIEYKEGKEVKRV